MDLISVLLNLVFDNIFVVVILFAIVSFLMNKGRGTSAPTGTPPRRNAMPPFGGEGPFSPQGGGGMSRGAPNARDLRPEQPQVMTFETVPAPVTMEQRGSEPSMSAFREPSTAPAERSYAPKRAPVRPAAAAVSAPQQRPMALHARNAAQGMIWSEVFGPPRAVRPHQLRRK